MPTEEPGLTSRQELAAVPLGVFRLVWCALMVYHLLHVVYGSSELRAKFGDHTTFNFRFGCAESCVLLRPTEEQARAACLTAVVAAVAVGAGLPQPWHALGCTVLATLYTTLQLWEKSRYNNHYYLDVLFAILVASTDVHRAFSVSSMPCWRTEPHAISGAQREELSAWYRRQRALTAPAWQLWAFRMQVLLVYVYGAVAKLSSPDWLARAQPMTGWLQLPGKWTPLHSVVETINPGDALNKEILGWVFSIGGVAFDLGIAVPLLLSTELNPSGASRRRWRWLALASTAVFHGTNAMIFNIGTFPFMMMGANCLFLLDAGAYQTDAVGVDYAAASRRKKRCGLSPGGLCVAVTYACVQLLLPVRHHFYPGPVMWTGLGYHGSWMMKLADNRALVRMLLDGDPPGANSSPHTESEQRPPLLAPLGTIVWLTPGQLAPALLDVGSVEQLAEHVQLLAHAQGVVARLPAPRGSPPPVHVEIWRAWNFRPYQRWSDPAVELPARRGQCGSAGGSFAGTMLSPAPTWLVVHPIMLRNEQEQEIRQRVELLSGNTGSEVPMGKVSAPTEPRSQRERRTLLMMEAAERGLGDWSAFLPGAGPSTPTAAVLQRTGPACDDILLHAVLGEVSVRVDAKSAELLQPGDSMRLPVGAKHTVSPGISSTTESPSVWAYSYTCADGELHAALQLDSAAAAV